MHGGGENKKQKFHPTMQSGTRNSLTFVNTTAIAYTKMLRLRRTFCIYAIAVVFTNVRELRVLWNEALALNPRARPENQSYYHDHYWVQTGCHCSEM